jgi:hypothetical protein
MRDDRARFQFSLATLMLLMAIVPFWCVCALIANPMRFHRSIEGPFFAIVVFAGITAALYRLVGGRRYGWAIAAPALPVAVLFLIALLDYARFTPLPAAWKRPIGREL